QTRILSHLRVKAPLRMDQVAEANGMGDLAQLLQDTLRQDQVAPIEEQLALARQFLEARVPAGADCRVDIGRGYGIAVVAAQPREAARCIHSVADLARRKAKFARKYIQFAFHEGCGG